MSYSELHKGIIPLDPETDVTHVVKSTIGLKVEETSGIRWETYMPVCLALYI